MTSLPMSPDQELLHMRARIAKAKSDFFAGISDTHPHGISGLRFILPYENDRRCLDTAPGAYSYSEWGNAAGITV